MMKSADMVFPATDSPRLPRDASEDASSGSPMTVAWIESPDTRDGTLFATDDASSAPVDPGGRAPVPASTVVVPGRVIPSTVAPGTVACTAFASVAVWAATVDGRPRKPPARQPRKTDPRS